MDFEKQVEEFKSYPREMQLFIIFIALGNFFKSPVGLSLDEKMDRDCIIVMKDKDLLFQIKNLIDKATTLSEGPEV